jgi:CcmD family protein
MPGLDHNAPFLLVALGITIAVLGGYVLYLRSRLRALRQRMAATDYSARNVSAAPPRATTAQPASSANEPSTP